MWGQQLNLCIREKQSIDISTITMDPTAAKPIILREQYEFIILEECDDDVVLDMEQKHIDALSLCNIVNKKRARRTAEQKRQYTKRVLTKK
jgi:hypothetical protein